MYILGIDTGLTKKNPTAWAIYASVNDTVIATASLAFPQTMPWEQRVQRIAQAIEDEARRNNVAGIAIETPWVGRDPQSALKLGALLGSLLHVSGRLHVPVFLVTPAEAAQALGISGRREEKKAAAIRMVQQRFSISVTDHQSDAIAVALHAAPKLDLIYREMQQQVSA